jgi:hypothetical protein
MSRAATWTNKDGLVVGFGTHSEDNEILTKVGGTGADATYKIDIVGVNLVDTYAAANTPPQSAVIPRGSYIKSATLHVTEAFTSTGSATLDIGLWTHGLATDVVDDADGIDVDIALTAIDALGDVVLCDGAVVGALVPVGRTGDGDCVVAPSYETAVFTAGKATLTLEVILPSGQNASPRIAV